MKPDQLFAAPSLDHVPWDELQAFGWVRDLAGCIQDPIHHAEGDVWIHTRMVLEELLRMPAWRALGERDRLAVWLGCLMHDIAKPRTTRVEDDGRITAKGHSRAGELMARKILWELGAPFALREEVCGLIRHHQVPFFLVGRSDALRMAAEISFATRCDLLALVAEADMRGRTCADAERILLDIDLFRELCREEGCFDAPRHFASTHTRVVYFRSEGRHPDVEAYDDTRAEVILMCGLPGSGKDTYVRDHLAGLPVVSLDDLREELDVEWTDNQGQVLQAARERAKEHLRRRERFVWNATNLTKQRRSAILQLAADYGARAKIVYVESPARALFAHNRARTDVVSEQVIRRMASRWEVPTLTEAHEVVLAVREVQET